MNASEIVDRMNELEAECEKHEFTFIEYVDDVRADDGLPPLEGAEREAAIAECDRNADIVNEIEKQLEELRQQFFELTGHWLKPSWANRWSEWWVYN